jgi:hypothetical protein
MMTQIKISKSDPYSHMGSSLNFYSDVEPPIVNYPIYRNISVGYEERPEYIPCNSNYLLKPILINW